MDTIILLMISYVAYCAQLYFERKIRQDGYSRSLAFAKYFFFGVSLSMLMESKTVPQKLISLIYIILVPLVSEMNTLHIYPIAATQKIYPKPASPIVESHVEKKQQ